MTLLMEVDLMGDYSRGVSVAFFIAFCLYNYFGVSILHNNVKSRMHRWFFLVCLALSLWSLCFSFAAIAPDVSSVFFWRRISALGWGSLYSVLLYFFLILTGKDVRLGGKWLHPLLFLPAAATIYAFSLSGKMAQALYAFERTPYGWINVAGGTVWDWLFNVYYVTFTLASIALLSYGMRQSDVENQKKLMRFILSSFVVAALVGTLTDLVANYYLSITLPQMAPVVILLPVSAICYSIKRYGFLNIPAFDENETILNSITRNRLYNYIALALIEGSLLNVLSGHFAENPDFRSIASTSIILAFFGLLVKSVTYLRVSDSIKDGIVLSLSVLIIPLITLRYVGFAGKTVWAFPFVLLIAFTVFNKRNMMVILGLMVLSTSLMVWAMAPTAVVKINPADHIARLGLMAMGFLLASHVNRIYLTKLRDNYEQLKLQKLIGEISSDFINVSSNTLDAKVNSMLEKCGTFFGVDRVYLFMYDNPGDRMNNTHEWCSEGTESRISLRQDIPAERVAWLMGRLSTDGSLHIPDLETTQDDDFLKWNEYASRGNKSLIILPVHLEGGVHRGFIGFDSVKAKKNWDAEHIDMLEISANMLSNALAKIDAEKEQTFLAYYDQLTRLPNRALFKDRARQAIHLAKRNERIIGVLFLDLDSFSNINDSLGHTVGDELVRIIAQKLSENLRKSDTVARFGGDNFLLLINNLMDVKDLSGVADKVMSLFSEPFIYSGQEFYINANAGAAVYPVDGEDVGTLVKNAEVAMFSAKETGVNRCEFCSPQMKENVKWVMKTTNRLYRALERKELVLHYQPQIDVLSGDIVGVEALLRWNHSEEGLLTAGAFVPLAEKTGLINHIGEWVIKTACEQNKCWQDRGLPPIRIAVNMSVSQFNDPKLAERVAAILMASGLKPEYLELELTENIVMKNPENVVETLRSIKRLGVSVAIDDFGIEYSSLSRLTLLPIDRMKMDIEFVRGIEGTLKERAIASNIITLAKSLGLSVIAEGVETQTQLAYLKQQGCDEVQGYYFHRPMPADEIQVLLSKQGRSKPEISNYWEVPEYEY